MAHKPDKQTRKAKRNQWRAEQRDAARAALHLPDERMQAMFDMLDAALPVRGCDHTLRLVREWAQQQAIAFDVLQAWCRENGGYCDCEVLANCEDCWLDAKHDVGL